MPTPDLPVELWLEILSYLPRSALRKLVGINRTLFELALNDIYEEVRFISNDKDMLRTFKQLSHKTISRRVRHLFIRPAFLPGIDEIPSLPTTLKHKFASSVTFLKNASRNPLTLTKSQETSDELMDPTYEVLTLAKRAVKSCPNLRTITITVHDHFATPLFLSFLDSLWKSDSLGRNIRKITIDTTASKIPLFVKPLVKAGASGLTNFEEFEINLTTSRFTHSYEQWLAGSSALVSLFTTFRNTFTHLTFSSMVPADLSAMFDKLPRLPKLTSLEIMAVLNAETFPSSEPLTRFIAKHSTTLRSFTVKPHARHVSFHHSDDTYTTWLTHEELPRGVGAKAVEVAGIVSQRKLLYSFTQLELTNLRTLEVGLRELSRYRMDPNLSGHVVLPRLSRIAPSLTKLVLTDASISARHLSEIMQSLVLNPDHPPTSSFASIPKPMLEELSFVAYNLSPYMLDLLAKCLPNLKSLTIQYGSLSPNTSLSEAEPAYDPDYRTVESRFKDAMHARRLTKWGLTYLRLLKPSACGYGHPCVSDMKIVAQSLSENVVLGTETARECQCTAYNSEASYEWRL